MGLDHISLRSPSLLFHSLARWNAHRCPTCCYPGVALLHNCPLL